MGGFCYLKTYQVCLEEIRVYVRLKEEKDQPYKRGSF